ncbi:MAG: VOC family protein [Dehalococcoidia bacterium]|nr:VOC family protein [Dehalococcoidia bacterium]
MGLELGAFSVSLSVADIEVTRAFYEKLGFSQFAGDPAENWLIMRNGDHVIGLFCNMLEKNTLTFNPGRDQNANKLDTFTDIRVIQRRLKAEGMSMVSEVDETTTGPASLILIDPDGNPIFIDQHV